MNYTPIDSELERYGLRIISLAVLHPDANPYAAALLQPLESVTATPNGIQNENSASACTKHSTFLRLALEQQVDLAMTPEYSTPWHIIEELIINDRGPAEGKLWVLGCESITPGELQELTKKHSTVKWIVAKFTQTGTQYFLDPICYLFRATDGAGTSHLVLAVQFKEQPMSDPANNLERDYMMRGTECFIFRNNENSICLVTLICSDALGFKESMLPQSLHIPYLILHPQLNRDPRYNAFKAYRNDAYLNNRDRQEFLCVNWAKGFRVPGYGPSEFGGSGYYLKSDALTLDDERMNANHDRGLYYTICQVNRSNIYFFNYCEHVFCFQTTKPSQAQAVGVLQRRTGPEMIRSFSWNIVSATWDETPVPDDGFIALCARIKENLSPLSDPGMSCLNKERLLALSNGAIKSSRHRKWFEPMQLLYFGVKEDEVVRRMTFVQDPDREAYNYRYQAILNFSKLRNQVVPDLTFFPKSIAHFHSDCSIDYPVGESFNHNLLKHGDGSKATVAYVGRQSETEVDRAYNEIYDVLEDDDRVRLVVWFENPDGHVEKRWFGNRPLITTDLSEGSRSISRRNHD
jgi:hypothetical protein